MRVSDRNAVTVVLALPVLWWRRTSSLGCIFANHQVTKTGS